MTAAPDLSTPNDRGGARRRAEESRHALIVRLDSAGDVLLAGPAVRAVAAHADRVTLLVGPRGQEAAGLLPGVDDVIVWRAPWVDLDPPPIVRPDVDALVDRLMTARFDDALILTSFHQSPLPTALLLRLARVPRIAAISADYPGSLLDVRHRVGGEAPEPERGVSLAKSAGFPLPPGDHGLLAVRGPMPDVRHLTGEAPYVVLHPGASAPARRWPAWRCAEAVGALRARGWDTVVTGTAAERELTACVAGATARDLGGRTTMAELAAILAGAAVAVVANTGPAHLAAAVGTPVVSLFAPVMSAACWAPYGVPAVLLGDQGAACRGSRARVCPLDGHPCLSRVTGDEAANAVDKLAGEHRRTRR